MELEVKDKAYWHRRAILSEANWAVGQRRLESLRDRASDFVNNASKVAKKAKELANLSNERADNCELENAELKKQINRMREALRDGNGLMSGLEEFIMEMPAESESYKYVKRTLVKACHPDKHQNANTGIKKSINQLFIIVNSMFGG